MPYFSTTALKTIALAIQHSKSQQLNWLGVDFTIPQAFTLKVLKSME